MGRNGITYQDVAHAAEELCAQGKLPTVAAIRALIGGGSHTTITAHLRIWKEQQGDMEQLAFKEKIPEELLSLIKGLWQRMVTATEEQITVIKDATQQTVLESQQKLDVVEQEKQRWQINYQQSQQEQQILIEENRLLKQEGIDLKSQYTILQSKTDQLIWQVQEKAEHINELHRLSVQAQANYEHFEEASREQRLIQQQQHEQQQRQSEQLINQYQQENTQLKSQCSASQHQLHELNQENKNLTEQHHQLTTQLNGATAELRLAEERLAQVSQSEQQWRSECQQQQSKVEQGNQVMIDLQKQLAVLLDKMSMTEKALAEVSSQNKELAHEKWILAQEKTQLLDQLQQLQHT